MKKFLLMLLLSPLMAWAGVAGVWQDNKGAYWVVFHEATGTGYALKVEANLTQSTLWVGTLDSNTLQLTSTAGEKATLGVNTSSTILSGNVGGEALTANTVLTHFGSGYDGVYDAGNGRYLVYLTAKDNLSTAVLLMDVAVGSAGLTNQVYWGQFSLSTRKLSASSLTTSGASAELTFDETGSATGIIQGLGVSATALIHQVLPEGTRDYLGYSTTSPGYAWLAGKSIKVVNLPEEGSFFAFYQPTSLQKGRIMVVVHGTDGTPYEELKDEVDFADQYGYTVLGIQWLDKATATYASPKGVYRTIGKALDHLQRTTGNDLSRVAYVGFSRGSAISYEVTWRDLQSKKRFDVTISHSGGIPTVLPYAPPADDPGVFYNALTEGTLGSNPMGGSKFFLYCGELDEQFGAQMCQWVNNAKTLIERESGSVVRLIDDPVGKHAGYRVNATYHAAGVQAFIDATP